jgi:hypothetical protein
VSWPKSTHFGSGRDARACGRIGGKKARHVAVRSAEWLKGYQAGWVASERWFEDYGRTRRGRRKREAA